MIRGLHSRWLVVLGIGVLALAAPLAGKAQAGAPAGGAQTVDELTFITENYPPYNFLKDGELRGIAVDLLVEIVARLDGAPVRDRIKLWPWARGYRQVLRRPATVLFSTTRTPARESLFKWVGPISPTTVSLIARKDRGIRIGSLADLARYKVGVVIDDIGEQLLLEAGRPVESLDRVSGSDVTSLSIRKLARGRIDLWSYERNVAMWEIRDKGFDPDDFESIHVLSQAHVYYAFHRDTPDALVERMQGALDDLDQAGVRREIFERFIE